MKKKNLSNVGITSVDSNELEAGGFEPSSLLVHKLGK